MMGACSRAIPASQILLELTTLTNYEYIIERFFLHCIYEIDECGLDAETLGALTYPRRDGRARVLGTGVPRRRPGKLSTKDTKRHEE